MNITEKEITYFLSVVSEKSFSLASEKMGVDARTISLNVTNLERKTGKQLFYRNTRSIDLTKDGQETLERFKSISDEMSDMRREIEHVHNDAAGEVRIDASPTMINHLIIPHVDAFMRANPEIVLKIRHTGNVRGVFDSGFDIMLRIGDLEDTELAGKTIFNPTTWIAASPEYLQNRPAIRKPSDLLEHNCIGFVDSRTKRNVSTWRLAGPSGIEDVTTSGNVSYDEASGLLELALDGIGVLLGVEFQLAPFVAQGRLTRILPEWQGVPQPVTLLYHKSPHMPLRVRKVIDFLSELRPSAP